MSDDDTLRQAIAEEEARLARIEKERAEVLAKLRELMGRPATEISAPAPATPILPNVLPFPPGIPSTAEEKVVLDHLQGRHVIGVYPLLPDETCFFLAADFDGPSWREDVAAFAATCRRIGVLPAIERSRSGKGAHAWFFFSCPVPASDGHEGTTGEVTHRKPGSTIPLSAISLEASFATAAGPPPSGASGRGSTLPR